MNRDFGFLKNRDRLPYSWGIHQNNLNEVCQGFFPYSFKVSPRFFGEKYFLNHLSKPTNTSRF
jgi:hypothetical protein